MNTPEEGEDTLNPELRQKVGIDQALKEIFTNPTTTTDLRTAGYYSLHSITLGVGRSNYGWDGGWQETARLSTDGKVELGAGRRFVGNGEFQLLPANEVRQNLVAERQIDFDRMRSDPDYRSWRVNKYAWEDPNSMARKYFDNEANRPSMETMFQPIAPELLDAEGRAFVDPRDGTLLYDHPLYGQLLGKQTAAEIKKKVTDYFDKQRGQDWWNDARQKANPHTLSQAETPS